MSSTFLKAVGERTGELALATTNLRGLTTPPPSSVDVLPPTAPPPPLPPTALPLPPAPAPANKAWCSGLLEADSVFNASSSASGSQALGLMDDGDTLLTRAWDGDDTQIGVYSLERGPLHSLQGHTTIITAISMNGDRFASADAAGSVRLWDLGRRRCFASASLGVEIKGLHLEGNYLCTGDADNKANGWHLGGSCAGSTSRRVWQGYKDSEVTLPACSHQTEHLGSVRTGGRTFDGPCQSTELPACLSTPPSHNDALQTLISA